MSSVKNFLLGLWKNNRPECICFGFLIALALFAFGVHEPWYDEIQAWQIARTASWYDILFRIPHFEGHPPLWFVLLAIPAKAGISGLVALRFIGMTTLMLSGFLIIFKAPFPRWIRFLLPFTYFLFIQYGIIVRPYGIMVLLMILLAMAFPSKDEHPGRFVGLLAALCACHLFGICIAGGITIAWLLEIKNGRRWAEFLRGLWRDKRFQWMLGLLVWAVLLMIDTFPASGTEADNKPYSLAILLNSLYYVLLGLPPDAFFTNLHKYLVIKKFSLLLDVSQFVMLAMGLICWTVLLAFLPKKKWKYLLFPFAMLACLMSFYCSMHHIGLFAVLVVWSFWISLNDAPFIYPKRPQPVVYIARVLLVFAVFVPLCWTAHQLWLDTYLPVTNSRNIIAFLKEKGLSDKRIFCAWGRRFLNGQLVPDKIYSQTWAVQLNFYTPHNMFANFHHGGKKAYNSFENLEGEDAASAFARWKEGGIPEVLVGEAHVEAIWPELSRQDYIPVYRMSMYDFWKFDPPTYVPGFIYVRRDVAQQLGLQDISLMQPYGAAR